MNNQLQLLDYFLVESSFKDYVEAHRSEGQGSYAITCAVGSTSGDSIDIEIEHNPSENLSLFVIPCLYEIKGTATEGDNELDAFTLSVKIELRYLIVNPTPNGEKTVIKDNESVIHKNAWALAAIVAQRTLDSTKYKGISLALSSPVS